MTEDTRVVGVDLGGAFVAAAVVDSEGRVYGEVERAIDRTGPSDDILVTTVETVRAACEQSGVALADVQAVGIALPGTVRTSEGLVVFSTTLNWEDVPVRGPVESALGRPVTVLNTIQATARGEMIFGAGRDTENFVCVSLGTQIGGAVVIDGEVYHGDADSAGEVGHITVDPDGPQCVCGNQGCLDALVSGPAISRMAAESLKLGAQSIITEWTSEGQPITAEHVYRAATEGDALAIKVWEKVGRYLGLGLATVITVLNPKKIILAGRLSQAYPYFSQTVVEEVRRRARMVPRDFTQIIASPLGPRSALMGAAAEAVDASGRPPQG